MREKFDIASVNNAGRPIEHRVELSKADREKLMQIAGDSAAGTRQWRAKLLLALDKGDYAPRDRHTYDEIAQECGVSLPTVFRTAKRFVNLGIEGVLDAQSSGPTFNDNEAIKLRQIIHRLERLRESRSIRSIAKELKRSPQTISTAIERLASEGEIIWPPNP